MTKNNQESTHRLFFNTFLARLYDFVVKVEFFGKEQKIRRIFLNHIPKNSKRILDLATGTGTVAIEIKKKFQDAKVVGVDLSNMMLSIARKKALKQNIEISFLEENIEKTKFPSNSFDVITLSFALHELPIIGRTKVMKEAHRILKSNGVFILMDSVMPKSWLLKMFLILLKLGLLMVLFCKASESLRKLQ